MTEQAIPDTVLAALRAAVGPKGVVEAADDKSAYLVDARQLYHGESPIVLRPKTTAEVAEIVGICAAANVSIVPQGGNTGYVGGGVPRAGGGEVLVSLGRMNRIREIDALDYTMTVEAGCVLAAIQEAAGEAERLFPLSLGAEGSCQIGGNLSTNAGGTAVLRYGNARDLVLGLEVVLADGRVWDGLRRLRKDNAGYDLKQVFLGAEGTLGIITAAVLKLFPQPAESVTAFVAVPNPASATALLARLREASGDAVTSFEYLHRICIDLVTAHIEGTADPFQQAYEHYVLLELSGPGSDGGLKHLAEEALGAALEAGAALDAVLAANQTQSQSLWRLRETVPEAQKHAGGSIKHDVSVPVSRVPEFLERATALAEAAIPGARVTPFGHLGDGNIHFNLNAPVGAEAAAFVALTPEITPRIHDLAVEMEGSFSAEHGIGQLKKPELEKYRPATDLALMAALKQALDPKGIMNPGKVV